jgi:hypothetical protein
MSQQQQELIEQSRALKAEERRQPAGSSVALPFQVAATAAVLARLDKQNELLARIAAALEKD